MNDSRVDDRRDVAHSTNPLGGQENIEQDALATRPDGPQSNVPPARTGKASDPKTGAQVQGRTSASGGADRIAPDTRIPEPVKQDLGFRRNSSDGER